MNRILIVDDEVVIRRLARHILAEPRSEIFEAGDCEAALQIARERLPHVVLLDIQMPGMSGFDACRALKSDATTAGAAIILCSGEIQDEDVREGTAAGAAGFLRKPFGPQALREAVHRHLSQADAASAPADGRHSMRVGSVEPPAAASADSVEVLQERVHDLERALRDERARAQELKAALERAKTGGRTEDLFVSLITQEMRAPLSALQGHVRLFDEVLATFDVTHPLHALLTALKRSGERLDGLARELLDFARLRSGLVSGEKKDVHLPTLLGLVAQELVPVLEARSLRIEIDVRSAFRALKADGERLREAISWLLRGAASASPVGAAVRVVCEDDGAQVILRVSDSGPALAPDEQEKIFRPYYPSRRQTLDGTDRPGLGLSIARRIVEEHGGGLHAETPADGGAMFVARLPRQVEAALDPRTAAQAAQGSVAGLVAALQTAESRLLVHAQTLSERLVREEVRTRQLEEALSEMERTYLETIAAIANAADAKDSYSLGHTERVTFYARCIARELNPALLEQREFTYSLLLHDLGKIGIAEELLKKAGRLSESEWDAMKSHAEIGVQLLSSVRFLGPALASVRSHHERYDGKGYPDGLRGDEIPLPARIIAVADAFEAITSDRPYRKGLPPEEARIQILANQGTQFDPHVVDAFERAWTDICRHVRVAQPKARSQRGAMEEGR